VDGTDDVSPPIPKANCGQVQSALTVPIKISLTTEAHDALSFGNTERISAAAQAGEKGCQDLDETQECSPVGGLIGDRLQPPCGLRADAGAAPACVRATIQGLPDTR
jgi:hypothetical protein